MEYLGASGYGCPQPYGTQTEYVCMHTCMGVWVYMYVCMYMNNVYQSELRHGHLLFSGFPIFLGLKFNRTFAPGVCNVLIPAAHLVQLLLPQHVLQLAHASMQGRWILDKLLLVAFYVCCFEQLVRPYGRSR